MTMKCREYIGRTTATQYRRPCERDATNEAYFLGEWVPVCARHRVMYSDHLPMRKVQVTA